MSEWHTSLTIFNSIVLFSDNVNDTYYPVYPGKYDGEQKTNPGSIYAVKVGEKKKDSEDTVGNQVKSVKLRDLMDGEADANTFIIKTDVQNMDCQVWTVLHKLLFVIFWYYVRC